MFYTIIHKYHYEVWPNIALVLGKTYKSGTYCIYVVHGSQANLRKFVENVVQGNVKKVEKMLDSGIDPNFITDDGSKCWKERR